MEDNQQTNGGSDRSANDQDQSRITRGHITQGMNRELNEAGDETPGTGTTDSANRETDITDNTQGASRLTGQVEAGRDIADRSRQEGDGTDRDDSGNYNERSGSTGSLDGAM
jgi:hypothetical protein